jgi:Putative DNA-binding domain
MNASLLESLLYQEESSTLDFKAQQYRFSKATSEEKSELLKDILAFSNAWRETDAHILIGVEEIKGGRSIVRGIPPELHLDDHNLQQFVSGKTNRPIQFSYAPFSTAGVEIGVLTIAIPDQRPFYLIDGYGRLEKNVVYIRRGSATVEAAPDEIARMATNSAVPAGQPTLRLELCDLRSRQKFGASIDVQPVIVELPADDSFPIYGKPPVDLFGTRMSMGSMDNNDYYADVGDYLKAEGLFCEIGVCVANSSTTLADTVVITLEMEADDSVVIADESERPTFPSSTTVPTLASHLRPRRKPCVVAGHYGKTAEVRIHMGSIQPGRTEFSPEPFFVAASQASVVTMRATISANNLRLPVSGTVEIRITPRFASPTVEQIVEYATQRSVR